MCWNGTVRERRGFLYHDAGRDRYGIDWRETLSIVPGELLLDAILACRPYMRGRLLDVGCGKRPYGLIYDSLVDKSIGTEVDYSAHGTAAADVVCQAERLPFASESFDTVLCTEVLEHCRQPFHALMECARVLRPAGHLLLSVPFIYPVHESPHDYWRFTAHGLEAICHAAGLLPLSIRSKGGIGATVVTLGLNVAVRTANGLSKLLRLSRSLRDRVLVRWLLSLPQWTYLRLARKRSARSRPGALDAWLTPGFVVLARRPGQGADRG
jgi:SAM-dependent methyltransferase